LTANNFDLVKSWNEQCHVIHSYLFSALNAESSGVFVCLVFHTLSWDDGGGGNHPPVSRRRLQKKLSNARVKLGLLGIHLDTNLSWSVHINSIASEASKRLYFLKQLKGAEFHKTSFSISVPRIRPVLEYAAPVRHHLINRTQAQQLESIQKRAIHKINNITRGMSYPNVPFVAELESLETWLDGITYQDLFSGYLQTNLESLPSHSTSVRYLCDHCDWDLPLPFLNPVYDPKTTVHLLTLIGLHHYQPKK